MIAYSTVTESDYARTAAKLYRRFRELIERLLAVEPPRYASQWDEYREAAGLVVRLEELLKLAPTCWRFTYVLAQARALRLRRTYFNATKVNARNLP